MSTKAITEEKSSGLADLEYDAKTRKRAEWEAFEFEITAENQVTVTNASYGHEKADHEYTVTVEQHDDGRITPLHCSCPAFMHQHGACKHMVAVAMRDVVLGAAVAYRRDRDAAPADPIVLSDGGRTVTEPPETTEEKSCDEDWCSGPRETEADDLPCFDCFRSLD